jgi:hypothetical protein
MDGRGHINAHGSSTLQQHEFRPFPHHASRGSSLLRLITVPFLALLTGCVSPLATPGPQQFETALTPEEVIRCATNQAVLNGFDVVLSDPVSGTLSVKKQGGYDENRLLLTCNMHKDSIAATHLNNILTVTLSYRRAAPVSNVVLAARTLNSFPTLQGLMALPANSTSCVSNGTFEAEVLRALKATQ